jgi:hypothetical protein
MPATEFILPTFGPRAEYKVGLQNHQNGFIGANTYVVKRKTIQRQEMGGNFD